MSKHPKHDRLFPELTAEQEDLILVALQEFKGNCTTMESALGALVFGRHFGWRVLKMIHNPTTYRNYEKLLNVRFDDVCPERTDYTQRNVGVRAADQMKSFWAVVTGKKKVHNKGVIDDDNVRER